MSDRLIEQIITKLNNLQPEVLLQLLDKMSINNTPENVEQGNENWHRVFSKFIEKVTKGDYSDYAIYDKLLDVLELPIVTCGDIYGIFSDINPDSQFLSKDIKLDPFTIDHIRHTICAGKYALFQEYEPGAEEKLSEFLMNQSKRVEELERRRKNRRTSRTN